MKKGFLLGALLLGAGAVSAQGLYVAVGGGYGFATPSDKVGETLVVSSTGDQTSTAIYDSYGGGSNVGLNVGYMFSEHLGAELGLNYFSGSSVTSRDVTVPTGTASLMGSSNQIRLAPSLVLTTGGDFAVYGKGGLVLPVSGSTISEGRDGTNPLAVVEQEIESKGSTSIGFQGALGASYSVSDKISVFGELSAINLRIKSGTQTVTKYTVNGDDFLGNLTEYQKETVFVDELNSNSNNTSYNLSGTSDTSAKEEIATTTNFNGFFINIGVKYNF